jgi:uncharacterized protein YwqG
MPVLKEIEAFKKSAWIPITVEGDGSRVDSKFAGTPFIPAGEDYPLCGNCGKPLQLFLQLDLSKIPDALGDEFGHGLLQFFYCTSEEPLCENDCEAFFPFAKSVLTRIIATENLKSANESASFSGEFPPKVITSWEEKDDFPNKEEGAESLGIEMNHEQWDEVCESEYPISGDKLAGYPMWIQGVEYSNCPVCGEQMRLLFQIDSEDNIPYMFGDVGCGHLTQCKNHKDQLAFGWACG